MPWLGFFNKIFNSDILVVLDTAQFKRRSFMNRNRIKTENGVQWLTIPLIQKGNYKAPIKNMKINNDEQWQKKHWGNIERAYSKSRFFKEIKIGFNPFYNNIYDSFVNFCMEMYTYWFYILDIRITIVKASDIKVTGDGNDLILNICKELSVDEYISGPFGKEYLKLDEFSSNKIKVSFHDYRHPAYPQLYGEFVPYMGIIDLVANVDNPKDIICSGGNLS